MSFVSYVLSAIEEQLDRLPEAIAFPAMIVSALAVVGVTYAFQLACIRAPSPHSATAASKGRSN